MKKQMTSRIIGLSLIYLIIIMPVCFAYDQIEVNTYDGTDFDESAGVPQIFEQGSGIFTEASDTYCNGKTYTCGSSTVCCPYSGPPTACCGSGKGCMRDLGTCKTCSSLDNTCSGKDRYFNCYKSGDYCRCSYETCSNGCSAGKCLPSCNNQCSSVGVEGCDYSTSIFYKCAKDSSGCLYWNSQGVTVNKCNVECKYDSQCSYGYSCQNYKCAWNGKPDLTIEDIWADGDLIENSGRISFRLKNIGNANAGSNTGKFYVDGTLIHPFPLNSLNAGNSQDYYVDFNTISAGIHTIKFVADGNSEISESNENNNERQESFSWKVQDQPDLIVDDIWTEGDLVEGGDVTLKARLKNIGNANAKACSVKIYFDNNYLTTFSIAALYPDYYTVSSTGITNVAAGTHTIKYVVDVNSEVSESNENNNYNQKSFVWRTKDKPDLIVYDAWADNELVQGGFSEIKASFRNTGNALASSSVAKVYLDGSIYDSFNLAAISPGGEIISTTPFDSVSAGTHVIRYVVDANSQISESNEANNEKQETFTWKVESKPDLIIDDIWAEGELFEGDGSQLRVRINNLGSKSAGQFYFSVYFDGVYNKKFLIDSLAAGSYTTWIITFNAVSAGTHTIKFKADHDNAISEYNENNNERQEPFVWSAKQANSCPVPDGSSATCDCNYNHECPLAYPYCEAEYPPPISDGFDACVARPPTGYCGDGVCSSPAETGVNCPKDCRSFATLNVDVKTQQGSQMPGAKIYMDGNYLGITDSSGRVSVTAGFYSTYNFEAKCSDGQSCGQQNKYVDESVEYVNFACSCSVSHDSDADGYSDEEEILVGTDPKNSNSNIYNAIGDPQTASSCLDLSPLFSWSVEQGDVENLVTSFQSMSLQEASTLSQTSDAKLLLESSAGLASLEQRKADSNKNMLYSFGESDITKITSVGPTVMMVTVDQQGLGSVFIVGAACTGTLVGILPGIGYGIKDDALAIASIPELVWKAVSFVWQNKKLWDSRFTQSLVQIYSEVKNIVSSPGTFLYKEVLLPVFSDGAWILGKVGVESGQPEYVSFQMGFMEGFIGGYIAEQILLIDIVIARAFGLLKQGIKIGKFAGKASLEAFEKIANKLGFGTKVADTASNLKVWKAAQTWDDNALEGLALLVEGKGDDAAKALNGMSDAEVKLLAEKVDSFYKYLSTNCPMDVGAQSVCGDFAKTLIASLTKSKLPIVQKAILEWSDIEKLGLAKITKLLGKDSDDILSKAVGRISGEEQLRKASQFTEKVTNAQFVIRGPSDIKYLQELNDYFDSVISDLKINLNEPGFKRRFDSAAQSNFNPDTNTITYSLAEVAREGKVFKEFTAVHELGHKKKTLFFGKDIEDLLPSNAGLNYNHVKWFDEFENNFRLKNQFLSAKNSERFSQGVKDAMSIKGNKITADKLEIYALGAQYDTFSYIRSMSKEFDIVDGKFDDILDGMVSAGDLTAQDVDKIKQLSDMYTNAAKINDPGQYNTAIKNIAQFRKNWVGDRETIW